MSRDRLPSPRSLRGSSMVRLRIGLLVITMVVSVFGARLFQLQGVDANSYAEMAEQAGLVKLALPAKRGEITDRAGAPLAESVQGTMIVADPTRTAAHAQQIAKVLSDKLDLDYFDLLTRLQKKHTRFQYIARRIPSTVATSVVQAIKDKGIKGLATRPDPLRDYPGKDVAANLIGFMGSDGDALAGLEMNFDKLLSGTDGSETYEVGGGNRIPLGENDLAKPRDGKNLQLTIDRDVQWYTQRVLRAAVQSSRADSGSAVVMDTRTGEVLSFADYPTFDANAAAKADKADLGSRGLSDVYEPGSVEKVLTVSSLLDQGKVTPRTRITVPKELPVMDRVIHDWFDHDKLRLTLTGVIARSSNIGTALAAMQATPEKMRSYLSKFGLGERTRVGMPGETRGLLPAADTWSKVKQATIAFGQGLSVNALQMTTAVNAVANDGVLVTPSLVKGSATTNAGHTVGTDTTTTHRVVSKKAAGQMARMMEMVPNPETGTAPGAQVPGYRVAGKTGTAQRVGEKCGCYDGTFTVSFAGFAPADNPRFTVYVVVQNPRNGGGGGSIGGPAFSKIMSYVLGKYAVPPTGTPHADLPIEW